MAVPMQVAVSGKSQDGSHPVLRTTAPSKRVVSKLCATGLDARQTGALAPGGRWSLQVAAWVSWGGPEPCQLSVPSALGCQVPGWARSHGQSDPGAASLSRGRSVALDMEDGSLPCCPCAWHGMERWMLLRPLQSWTGLVLDWDWMRTGLGLAWDRTGKWQHFRCSRGSTVSPSAEPAVL